MTKLNLTPTINLQRPDKKGNCAIRIRSSVKKKLKFYHTGVSVLPEQFENREVINHPNKNVFNATIRAKIVQIEKDFEQGITNPKPLKKIDFHTFADAKVLQQKGKDAHGTWKHKKSYHKKLKAFKAHLQFSEITPSFMLDFENYCRSIGNKPTTVWSSIKFVTTMINAAINDKVIPGNPMRGYKKQAYVNPVRNYLTEEEIERMEKFVESGKSETLVKVASWFLFGCYTGLRYEDVKKFTKKNIINERVGLRTGKYKTDVSIKLHPRLEYILYKISPDVYSNQKMNEYLKVVAEKCDIDKNITFHTSRHTFAVYFLNKGGSMETLSKLLGHSSLKTTSIYGKITNIRVDDEMTKVWGKLGKKGKVVKIKKSS